MDGDDSQLLVRENELGIGIEKIMSASRSHYFSGAAVTAAILLYAGAAFAADEDVQQDDADTIEEAEVIEEIVVYANKHGGEVDLDARYAELFRSRASAELDRLDVLEEEYEWRKTMSETEDTSRIKWGYDAEAEMSMRRDTSLTDLPTEDTRPATLFRVQF
jgi:hypothetical protein